VDSKARVSRDDPLWWTDPEIDGLVWRFLNSDYAAVMYMHWPLDRRLEGFLRHCGLTRVADDGDLYSVVLDRVMAHIGSARQ
jgi:hypothetical protein